MTTICGEDAAASFAVFASVFAVPAPGRGSNVVNGSWRALASGFPRRRRGRFGSAIGSSDAAEDAFAVAGGAGAFAVSGGGVGALAGGAVFRRGRAGRGLFLVFLVGP